MGRQLSPHSKKQALLAFSPKLIFISSIEERTSFGIGSWRLLEYAKNRAIDPEAGPKLKD